MELYEAARLETGRGVPQDAVAENHVLAHMWLNIAGANGNEDSRYAMREVEAEMTPEQVAEARRRIHVCFDSGYRDC